MPLINKWVYQRHRNTPRPVSLLQAAKPALLSLPCRLAALQSLPQSRTLRVLHMANIMAVQRQAGGEQRALAERSDG